MWRYMYSCINTLDTWIQGYTYIWIHRYMDMRIQYYIYMWIHKYMNIWIHGFTDSQTLVSLCLWLHGWFLVQTQPMGKLSHQLLISGPLDGKDQGIFPNNFGEILMNVIGSGKKPDQQCCIDTTLAILRLLINLFWSAVGYVNITFLICLSWLSL